MVPGGVKGLVTILPPHPEVNGSNFCRFAQGRHLCFSKITYNVYWKTVICPESADRKSGRASMRWMAGTFPGRPTHGPHRQRTRGRGKAQQNAFWRLIVTKVHQKQEGPKGNAGWETRRPTVRGPSSKCPSGLGGSRFQILFIYSRWLL